METGTQLGSYELVDQIGAGGMGDVYRARDTRLDRLVALKILPAALSEDPDRLARFEREAKTLAQLNHPNIVTIHSVEQVGEHRFLTMELVEGHTLADEIGADGMSLPRFLELGRSLAEALAAAHEAGITHRDLKPANVMVTRAGQIKVLDFGLAKRAGPADDSELTRQGTELVTRDGIVVGTVPYMSPEQLEGRAVDHRSDVFSLGILFYEMITGRRPFQGRSQPALMSSILRDAPARVLELRPGLPRHLDRMLNRCLEKEPARRYQSASSLAYELEQLEVESGPGAGGEPPPSERIPSPAVEASGSGAHPESRTRLAVLPFMNRGGNPDDQYFTDGLAEELINALGTRRGLRVTARSSAFQFRGQEVDVREVGDKLDVEIVLEGSVRIAGERLRVTTELVSCSDGALLWSDRFDGQMRDVFDTQDEIVQAVVSQLDVRLGSSDEVKIKQAEPDNLQAYHLVLKARHHKAQFGGPSLGKAIEALERAVELEPTYAVAHAELAACLIVSAFWGDVAAPEAAERARKAAIRALDLDPGLDVAHAALGADLLGDLDWEAAERSARRALAINPNRADNHFWAACLMSIRRRHAEAIEHGRRMVELDPLNPPMRAQQILFLAYALRFPEAVAEAESALEDFPSHWFVAYASGFAHWTAGDPDRARPLLERAVELSGGRVGGLLVLLATMAFESGDAAGGERWLARAEELEASHPGAVSPAWYQGLEFARGNREEAFRIIERARAARDPHFPWTRVFCEARGRLDESLGALLDELGLP